jgi:hypothetical protein
MKKSLSLKKNAQKAVTTIKLLKVIQSTPKLEKRKFNVAERIEKKVKDTKEILISNIVKNNLNEKYLKLSKFSGNANYITTQNQPKDIIRKLITKNFDQNKFIKLLKYVHLKLYDNYGYPYIGLKFIENEKETFPIYYDYYKINKILRDVKCRLVAKYHDFRLEFNNNEYLIRYLPRKDYYIVMKYLLFFVYGYDRITYSKRCQKYYDLNEVKFAFHSLISSNNNSSEENNIENNKNQKVTNETQKVSKFNTSLNMKQISYKDNSNKNHQLINKKRYSIDFNNKNKNINNIIKQNSKFSSNRSIIDIKKNIEKNKTLKNKNNENITSSEYYVG